MSKCICVCDGKCTACSACTAICPQNCIELKIDENGNYYPRVDESKCLDCGLCSQVCPLNTSTQGHAPICGYVTRCLDTNSLIDCNSGGFFAALAEYVVNTGGIVFGVILDDANVVRHIKVNQSNAGDLEKLRGSKYVKSNLDGVFKEIAELLSAGEYVCFSGTPCQVAGLRSYLRRDYDNLLCVDLVCHGTTLPTYFRKYMEYMEKKYGSHISSMKFRNKTYGYHSGSMKIEYDNGKNYYGSGRVDYFLKAYYSGATYSEACYDCLFKGMKRYGDFTVFDSWHVGSLVEGLVDDDKGYTNVYVNTEKAVQVFDKLKSEIVSYEADANRMKELDGRMIDISFKKATFRDDLLRDCEVDFEKAAIKYLKVSAKDRIIESLKRVLYKSKVYRYISFKRR